MEFEGRTLRRTTFDAIADDYDRVRPGYPDEVFDDLAALADLSPGARLVEVGCGTGQATVPLAERRFDVTAVELGEHLAALAERRLAGFPNVRVVRAAFEDYAAVVPEWNAAAPPPPERVADRDRIKVFVDASGYFAPAVVRYYVWPVTFTARDYVTFLGTATNFRVLDESRRKRLSERIERRITTEHGGTVRKEFLGTLAVARRS